MLKYRSLRWLFVVSILLIVAVTDGFAKDKSGRFVFAYLEPGPYVDFTVQSDIILNELKNRGWADRFVLPKSLVYSAGWDSDVSTLDTAAREIMKNPDIDLILSMGTAATKSLLAVNNFKTPILGVAIAEPYQSKVIVSPTETGISNLTVRYIKDRWLKVFTLFHQSTEFKKIGIIYENSVNGKTFANLFDAKEVARERGFEIAEYSKYDPKDAYASCMTGVRKLVEQKIDAFYISGINCFDWNEHDLSEMFNLLKQNNIKVFANDGEVHVKRGALMGLSTSSLIPLGNFYVDKILAILKEGKLPGSLNINADYTPKIILNLEAATDLNIDFSLPILISSDKIFNKTVNLVTD